MPAPEQPTVLHYLGADDDHGGIVSVVHGLAATGEFRCVLGVNPGFVQRRPNPLPVLELPAIVGEQIGLRSLAKARKVAHAVRTWLVADPNRLFHGQSRAGLLVSLWLQRAGERRVVASVHCYGRQRWFYRWAARRLASRLYWLTPAMKRYYGISGAGWDQCIPNGLPASPITPRGCPLKRGEIVVGGAGMLVRWKGWHHVLEAIAQLPENARRRVQFRHIGVAEETADSRRYAEGLRRRTIELGLESQVQWLGWQPSSAGLLASIDAIVVPSCREPFSMIALEALFAGVPVIAGGDAGPADLIADGQSGWLYRAERSDALAAVLQHLLDTDALSRVNIDPVTLGRFSAPVVAGQWAKVYGALLAR